MKKLVVILAVLIIGFVGYRAWQSNVFNTATEMAQEVFPVWAGQGPFENGTGSAIAMWAAWSVVFSPDEAQQNTETFLQHRETYDADPETWAGLQADTAIRFGDPNMQVPPAKELAEKALRNGELQWLADGHGDTE